MLLQSGAKAIVKSESKFNTKLGNLYYKIGKYYKLGYLCYKVEQVLQSSRVVQSYI